MRPQLQACCLVFKGQLASVGVLQDSLPVPLSSRGLRMKKLRMKLKRCR